MALLDLIFPKICLGCGQIGRFLCPKCQGKLKVIQEVICPVCGRPSVGGQTHSRCRNLYGLDGLVPVWQYSQLAPEVIKTLKYQFVRSLVGEIGELAALSLKTRTRDLPEFWSFIDKKPILLPVPLHEKRLRWRGFNQAEVIGRYLAQAWNLPFSGKILERIKFTQPQVELKGKDRQNNIKGAFALTKRLVGKKPLQGRSLLLVDDVWTTGATMRECTKVLKRVGANPIWALTLAR